jgi:hypothetical protein
MRDENLPVCSAVSRAFTSAVNGSFRKSSFATQRADQRDFMFRRAIAHKNSRRNSELFGSIANSNAVIAIGSRNHAASRSDGESASSLLAAPRSLNEPVCCKCSSLSQTWQPVSSLKAIEWIYRRHADNWPYAFSGGENVFGVDYQLHKLSAQRNP